MLRGTFTLRLVVVVDVRFGEVLCVAVRAVRVLQRGVDVRRRQVLLPIRLFQDHTHSKSPQYSENSSRPLGFLTTL